ncbi:hypothetical protein BN938_1185 [Mucinivorans hirudinis]|uniref:Uncharacterized protein n=1 Tax=Mucinivorans hirudinis TaxID=1433126 RepID=A0A060RCW0_9BACT|nr:hypothetical protein BN938_1185 [Mucinivorans hirudinis]
MVSIILIFLGESGTYNLLLQSYKKLFINTFFDYNTFCK